MRKSHLSFVWLVAAVFAVTAAAPAVSQAAEFKGKGVKLWEGPAVVKANVSTLEQYDDNVFLEESSTKNSWINITTPEILLSVPMGPEQRHQANLLYSAAIGSISSYSEQNYVNQRFDADVKLNFPRGYLTVANLLRDTTDRADTEFTGYVRRFENTVRTNIGLEMNKLAFDVGYEHFQNDYRKSTYDGLEHHDDQLALIAYYQAFPKMRTLIEYDYRKIQYDKVADRDGHYNQVLGGLTWDMTGKTVGIAKLGWQGRDYDAESKANFNGFVSEIGFNTQFSARTRLDVSYHLSAEESTYGSSNYVDRNLLRAKLVQGIWDRISVYGGFAYRRDQYSEDDASIGKKRVDNVITPDVGIIYSLQKWVDFKVAYEYAHDSSNLSNSSYSRDLVSMSVTGYF